MFTAKTLAKAAFIKARNTVAAMDDDSILFEASCNDYELPACIFYRRELRRAERRIYAAMPAGCGIWDEVESQVKAIFDEVQPALDVKIEKAINGPIGSLEELLEALEE